MTDSANSQVRWVGRDIGKAWKWNGVTPFVLRSIAVRKDQPDVDCQICQIKIDTPTSNANLFKSKFHQTKKWSSLPKSPLHLEDESKLRNSNVDIITPRLGWFYLLDFHNSHQGLWVSHEERIGGELSCVSGPRNWKENPPKTGCSLTRCRVKLDEFWKISASSSTSRYPKQNRGWGHQIIMVKMNIFIRNKIYGEYDRFDVNFPQKNTTILFTKPKTFKVSKALDLIRSAGDKRWDFLGGMGCEMSDLKLEEDFGIYWKVLWKHPFCCWVYLVVVKGDFFGGGVGKTNLFT